MSFPRSIKYVGDDRSQYLFLQYFSNMDNSNFLRFIISCFLTSRKSDFILIDQFRMAENIIDKGGESIKKLKEKTCQDFNEAYLDWSCKVAGTNYHRKTWRSIIPQADSNIVPSMEFKMNFSNIAKIFHRQNYRGCRVFINAFLSDILARPEFNDTLKVYLDVEMSVESDCAENLGLKGTLDYAIALDQKVHIYHGVNPCEIGVVISLSKDGDFSAHNLWKCVAETAAVHKKRKVAGKEDSSVWSVLATGMKWLFLHIDREGTITLSEEYHIHLDWSSEEQVCFIYRALHNVIHSGAITIGAGMISS